MFFLIPSGQDRPSILDKNKDKEYHAKFGRYCLGQVNNQYHNDFLSNIQLNKNFYKGDQWVDSEDLEIFLKDESNQDRNRIKVIHNVIRPMVEQYRGNAIRMKINFRAKSISPQAINRRETKLAEMQFYSKIANAEGNPFSEDIKANKAVGDNAAETSSIFSNLYIDKFVEKINYLCEYVSERNTFEDKQVRLAEELALSGLAVMKTFEYAGHQEFKVQPSDNFFFDRSAKEYDLSDAGFQGDITYTETSEIFEQFPDIEPADRTAIENYSKQYRKMSIDSYQNSSATNNTINAQNYSGKVPVYTIYWKDGEFCEYGYVKDEFGYPYFAKINYVYNGEKEPRYTDKDLIKVDTQRSKKLLGDNLKTRNYVDVVRMAIMIPREVLAHGARENGDSSTINDVVLEWGIAPYQETENIEYHTAKYPYKCYCWGYVDGEILSPIDDAINPQRLVNRILSVAENQISNSRGSGTVIDKTMVTDSGDVLRKMNRSEPVLLDARGRGIQNAIGSYDTTIKAGTMGMFEIIERLKKFTQDTSGINEAIKGESTGSDQLVGVTELMIQRGSLMQEPFYNALTMIFKQAFQSICTVGKRIYADNERNLSIAVGDEGMEMLTITKDMKLEDFRIFVKRQNDVEILINAGNQMLLQFYQMQLIDKKRFSNLWGRSTPDEISMALRASAKEEEELLRMNEKAAAQQAEEMKAQAGEEQAQTQAMADEDQARADIKDLTDKQMELKKEAMKGISKMANENPDAKNVIMQAATKNL
jgi:hypothetical protein